MGRTPCCEKNNNNGLKRGPWTPEEDRKLVHYIQKHGYGNWRTLPNNAGLQRCGKSCRLRWTNYLRPDIKRGRFSFEEEEAIIQLHSILGNKWSAIASRLPGRTDNEIKNYWNTHIRKKLLRMGIDPVTHSPRLDLLDLSSLLAFSSSQIMNMQQQLNPELLKLASSLFSNNNSSSSHHNTTTTHQQDIINCNPQIHTNSHIIIPQQHHFFVESNNNNNNNGDVDPYYQSNFHNDYFGSSSYSPQQQQQNHHQLTDDDNWHTNELASSSPFDAHQLPTSSNYDHYNNNNLNNVVVDETWRSFPQSNSNSTTYVNGSSCSTEDERESYVVSSNIMMFTFDTPHDDLLHNNLNAF